MAELKICNLTTLRAVPQTVPIFQRHADSQVVLPGGTSVKFLWRPYPSEILDQVKRWANGSDTAPNVAVTSSCLWHMLWTNNATEFASEMELLEQPVQQLLRKVCHSAIHFLF